MIIKLIDERNGIFDEDTIVYSILNSMQSVREVAKGWIPVLTFLSQLLTSMLNPLYWTLPPTVSSFSNGKRPAIALSSDVFPDPGGPRSRYMRPGCSVKVMFCKITLSTFGGSFLP